MTPFRPMVIDNRAPGAQFLDANQISDGLANLFASAINAPIAANQIRRQRDLDDQAMQRQAMLDQRAETWRGQDLDRQAERDDMAQVWQEAQIGNLQADNAREMAAMFGNGVNNTARRGIDMIRALKGLFGGGKGQSTPAASLWYTFKGDDGATYKLNRQTGAVVPAVPAKAPTPEAPVLPVEQPDGTAGEFPEGPGSSVMTLRRSGQPGVHSLGDLFGGIVDGWDPEAMQRRGAEAYGVRPVGQQQRQVGPQPAASAGAPPVDAAFIQQHAQQISALPPGQARQDYLRRLKAGNPALYAALIQSLTAQH